MLIVFPYPISVNCKICPIKSTIGCDLRVLAEFAWVVMAMTMTILEKMTTKKTWVDYFL